MIIGATIEITMKDDEQLIVFDVPDLNDDIVVREGVLFVIPENNIYHGFPLTSVVSFVVHQK